MRRFFWLPITYALVEKLENLILNNHCYLGAYIIILIVLFTNKLSSDLAHMINKQIVNCIKLNMKNLFNNIITLSYKNK